MIRAVSGASRPGWATTTSPTVCCSLSPASRSPGSTGVATPPRGATRLNGLTLPGFANAHSHSFHRALRGRTHSSGGTFWSWRDRMYELAAVTRSRRLRGPGDGDVRRDGARRLHGGRRVPLPPPRPGRHDVRRRQRARTTCRRRGAACRHPAHPARHVLPQRRLRHRVEPRATPVQRRIGAALDRARRRVGRHADVPCRSGNPLGARRRSGFDPDRGGVGGGPRRCHSTPTYPSNPRRTPTACPPTASRQSACSTPPEL